MLEYLQGVFITILVRGESGGGECLTGLCGIADRCSDPRRHENTQIQRTIAV